MERRYLAGPIALQENQEAHIRHTERCLAGFHDYLVRQVAALVGVPGMESGLAVAEAALATFIAAFPKAEVQRDRT